MKRPKTIIRDFLSRVLYGDTPCSGVSLHVGSVKSAPLLSKRTSSKGITSDQFKGASLDAFIDEILDYVNEGADDEDEDEEYYLYAFWDDGEQENVASRPIKPKKSTGGAAFQNQAWRALEAQMRINAMMAESIAKHGSIQMHHASRMVEEYGDVHLKLAHAEQANLDRTHERQLEAKRDERQAAMLEAGMQGLLACLPMFAGKLAGILPMGVQAMRAAPQYQMLKAMFEGTTPERWPTIMSWLESFPGTAAEKAALKMGIESVMTEMIDAENSEKANGQAHSQH